MTYTAKAAYIHQYGAPEVLVFEEVQVSAPAAGQVLIRNTVIGLNFVEVYYRRGTFPVPSFPAILGNEAAGIVEAVGSDVTSVKVGIEWSTPTTSMALTQPCAYTPPTA